MKRLSVRLSVVGAVLALGAAAIAHSLLSGPGEDPEKEEEVVSAQDTGESEADPPTPIVVDGDTKSAPSPANDTLQPPPSSLFERGGDARPVSHITREDDGEPTKSASAIPTADPTSSGGGFPIGEPTYGANEELPIAVVDSSSETPPPPSSMYGSPAIPDAPEVGLSSEPSGLADTSTDAPPQPGIAPPAGGSSAFPGETFPTGAPVSDASPPSPPDGFGGPESTLAGSDSSESPTNPALADDSSSSFPTPDTTGDRGALAPPVGAALAGGIAGAATAAALADGLPGPGANAAGIPGSPPVGISDYPSTAASSNPATQPDNGYGAGAPGPSSGITPTAPSAYSPTGFANDNSGRNLPPTTPSYASPAPTAGAAALTASNLPGDRQLEGQQAPSILIEKSAPVEIQVNRKATFQVRVRNNGNAPAHNVVVVDRVPNGTQFIDATPAVMPTANGTLVWQINAIKPGEEVVLAMNVLPQVAGEIGSVAQATFQAQASVRTICTKPELKLSIKAPEQVLIGQPAALEITVTNVGNGSAEKVILEEDVPEGFTHAAGPALEHSIGILRPQESRRLTLVLDSAKPGNFQNRLTVRGEGELFVEDVRAISVTTPVIQVAMQGPSLRYLDRQATYVVHVANPGTASARNVELITHLPKGMKYVTSDNHGQYDTQSHAVFWSLEELPADKQGDVHVTVLPIEPGNQKLKTDVRADLGLNEFCEHEVTVEGLAELTFVVSDVADPIEVGSDTTYEVKVHNRGSKPDSEIQLVAELPAGITPTSGDGPTQGTVQGQTVVFGPLARLGPDEDAVFKIHARGAATGDHVIRAQLRSTELRVPVTKEESTRVYTDN